MKTERIDKILSNSGLGSRKQVKELLKNGRVIVDGEILKKPDEKVDPEVSVITVSGLQLLYSKYYYIIMNKPAGYITATYDKKEMTVYDLLSGAEKKLGVFPVGRLDKDTEGLIIFTNDGEMAHRIMSPRYHVEKVYYTKVSGPLHENDVKAFESGIEIPGEYTCLPATLEILESGENSTAIVKVTEGKYHLIKRMFITRGVKVLYLKRLSLGNIELDSSLEGGLYRPLTEKELKGLKNLVGMTEE